MSFISSCCGLRSTSHEEDTEALLPAYDDDTVLQRRLHQKLHSYQMIRALTEGFMPSTEQLIVNLRTLLASDVLNPEEPDLSDSGRRLVRHGKTWLSQFIELLRHKNDKDQIQDFVWFLSKARVDVDTKRVQRRAKGIRVKADTVAAYESLRTVGSLLLTNSDFRLFLGDLETIGRQVFADTAFSLSNVAEEAGKQLEPSEQESKTLNGAGADKGPAPSTEDLGNDVKDVTKVVGQGLAQTGQDALDSLKENVTGEQKETLLARLKVAVTKLRKRNDYSESVSTIGLLFQRYITAYSRAADATVNAVQEDVQSNDELDRAASNFWSLLRSFGDESEWNILEEKVNKIKSHAEKDPEFEVLMTDVGASLQQLLTDPDFFESAGEKVDELREKAKDAHKESDLRKDISEALQQARKTFSSVIQDSDVANLISTTGKILSILSPAQAIANTELVDDSLRIFIPLLIQTIQYIPIPRLEVSTPELDLLLENLIIEPGRTINHSSFLPYKLRIETQNNLEIRKARQRTTAGTEHTMTVKLDGLSLRAEEIGFWLRAHSGLLRLADEGIASFALDERGIDIHLDLEFGADRLESLVRLKAVRVHVHKLTYALRRSRFSWLAWLLKPLLRPVLRKAMEIQLASAIDQALRFANRELLFARERLRATRIADPQDLQTFVRAVLARLTPPEDPDVFTAVGVRPQGERFKGVYAPGSVVKTWEEEARRAGERIEDFEIEGWRNGVFDVTTE